MSTETQANPAVEEQQPPKPKKDRKKKAKKEVRLPVLVDMGFSLARLMVVSAGLGVVITSLLAGAPMHMAFLRASAAIFVVGVVAWLLSTLLANGSIEAVKAMQETQNQTEQLAGDGQTGNFEVQA